jgi:hypothetical protein
MVFGLDPIYTDPRRREEWVKASEPDRERRRCVGKTQRGKGGKIMALADGHGPPIAIG